MVESSDLIAKIRRRGIHYDLRGKRVARYSDLVELGGLFKVADIDKRLPLEFDDLMEMQANGSLTNVFYYLEGIYFVDIKQLDLQLVSKLQRASKTHPPTNPGSGETP